MTKTPQPLLTAGLLALISLALLAACGASAGSGSAPPQEDAGSTGSDEASSGSGNPTLGEPDAPVLMVEWGDFQ